MSLRSQPTFNSEGITFLPGGSEIALELNRQNRWLYALYLHLATPVSRIIRIKAKISRNEHLAGCSNLSYSQNFW